MSHNNVNSGGHVKTSTHKPASTVESLGTAAATSDPGLDQITAQAAANLATAVASKMGGLTFHTISYPAGFNYYFLNMAVPSITQVYNIPTLNVVDMLLKKPADGSVVYGMDGGSFSETFSNIMSTAKYVLSTADQASVNLDNAQIDALKTAVVVAFTDTWGSPPSTTTTPVTYCLTYYATELKLASPNLIPNTYYEYKSAVLKYQAATFNALTIQQQQQVIDQRLSSLQANVINPGSTNGGLLTGNGTPPTYGIGYNFPSNTEGSFWAPSIEDTSGKNSVSVSFKVSNFSSSTSSVSVEGGDDVIIPIFDLFSWSSIRGGKSSQKDLSAVSASSAIMRTTFNGVTAVSVPPAQLSAVLNPTGWYDVQMLKEALQNVGQDLTGIQLNANTPQGHASYYGLAAGNFLRANTLLVSQLPVITMTFTGTSETAVRSAFQEQEDISVNFLWFSVGSASQSYSASSINVHSDGSTVDVTFGPPPPDPNIKNKDRVAFIMGGAIDAPPLFN